MSSGTRQFVINVVESATWGRHTIYATEDDHELNTDEIALGEVSAAKQASKQTLATRRASNLSKYTANNSTFSLASAGGGAGAGSAALDRMDSVSQLTLSPFESAMLATILEDTLTQLKILDSCNTEMRTRRILNDMERLLNIKFGVEREHSSRDELEGIDPKQLHCDQYKLVKLQRDRDCFVELIRMAYEELTLTQSFTDLRSALNALIAEKELMQFVTQEEAQNRVKRRELSRQLRQQRVLNQSQNNEADTTIEILLTNVEDVALNGDIRARYVRRWQAARDEQHRLQISETEATPGEQIELLKQGADNEQRVHAELENMISVDIEDTLQKMEEWMNKYDHDMEKIDLEIQFRKNDYQNMLDRRLWLEKTIEEHDVAMQEWNQFKDEREEERKFREMMHGSARCVQAWWRGLLVRKQLGPFKPAKKPKMPKK